MKNEAFGFPSILSVLIFTGIVRDALGRLKWQVSIDFIPHNCNRGVDASDSVNHGMDAVPFPQDSANHGKLNCGYAFGFC
jgi:hypothetical protein